MAFNVFDSPGEGGYFGSLAVGGFLSIIAVALRFIAARHVGRKLAAEDWFALAAGAILVLRCILGVIALSIINGRGIMVAADRPAYESSFKLLYVVQLITMPDQTMAKLSICCLYLRIFGVNRIYARWIWFLGGLQVVINVAFIFVQAFQCKPVETNWKWWVPGTCLSRSTGVVVVEPPNSVIDFFLVILAVVMVRSLKMPSRDKWQLRFLFGLGALAGIFGFVKVGVVYSTYSDLALQLSHLGIWALVQSFVSLVCCCAPVYKPLLPANNFWGRLSSKVSQYRLRRSRSGGLDDSYVYSESAGGIKYASSEQLKEGETRRSGGADSQAQSQRWVRVGVTGHSEGAAWFEPAEVNRVGSPGRPGQSDGEAAHGSREDNGYQMNAIHVQRSVDVV